MARLVAQVALAGLRPAYVELVVPKGMTASQFRQKLANDEWPHQWLETTEGDLLNLNHILLLSLLKR